MCITSAYFNGDSVRIDLIQSPGTGPSRVVVDHADVGAAAAGGTDSLCGPTDDRVLSADETRAVQVYLDPGRLGVLNEFHHTYLAPDGSELNIDQASVSTTTTLCPACSR